MDHCNGLPTITNFEAHVGKHDNDNKAKRVWPILYSSIIGMMLYLESNIKPELYFDVNHCERFTHNNKA